MSMYAGTERYKPFRYVFQNRLETFLFASDAAAVNVAWDFDSIAAALRPLGKSFRHDVNILVADKRHHSYEMRSYNLSRE